MYIAKITKNHPTCTLVNSAVHVHVCEHMKLHLRSQLAVSNTSWPGSDVLGGSKEGHRTEDRGGVILRLFEVGSNRRHDAIEKGTMTGSHSNCRLGRGKASLLYTVSVSDCPRSV